MVFFAFLDGFFKRFGIMIWGDIMKKHILLLMTLLLSFVLVGCNREIPDYTVEEAFALMNESIDNYLSADSLSLDYFGAYTATNYTNSESMNVKMKNMQSSDLIGKVKMDITENDTSFTSQVDYSDGVIYTYQLTDGNEDYSKKTVDYNEYRILYQSFLKSTCDYTKTRNAQIVVDEDTLIVTFEYYQDLVESTFFVSNVMQSVSFATVSITLTHDAKLLSMIVSYDATINSVVGHESYQINIIKLNQYIIIDQLSNSQKSVYVEATTDGS